MSQSTVIVRDGILSNTFVIVRKRRFGIFDDFGSDRGIGRTLRVFVQTKDKKRSDTSDQGEQPRKQAGPRAEKKAGTMTVTGLFSVRLLMRYRAGETTGGPDQEARTGRWRS